MARHYGDDFVNHLISYEGAKEWQYSARFETVGKVLACDLFLQPFSFSIVGWRERKNGEDATMSTEIIREFWQTFASSPFLMVKLDNGRDHALPMTAQLDEALGPDRGGAIWFFTDTGNRLAAGGAAMAQYVSKDHDLFACLSGKIVRETDAGVIDRFWSNSVAAWYDKGRDDPKLLMLRMELNDVEIWTADMGLKGWFKLLSGKPLKASEAGQHVHEML
jgi:general stress protein 26